MKIDIFQVDAFSSNLFGGNPAGVVPNAKGLTEKDMQNIAREMNLSETAFVEILDRDFYQVRFFTVEEEVDLCGHATIGTFFLFAENEYIDPIDNGVKKIYQKTKAGKLPVYIHYKNKKVEKVSMEQSNPKDYGLVKDLDALLDSLGLKLEEIGIKNYNINPRIISTGLKDILLPVKTKESLDKINIDKEKLIKVSIDNDVVGVHAFYISGKKDEAYVRNFAPKVGIEEESATGTSNGALISYLKSLDFLKENKLICHQGEILKRPSEIYCEISKDDKILVGGKASVVLEGKMNIRK